MSTWGVFCVVFGGLCGLAGLALLVLDLMKSCKTIGTIIGNSSSSGESVEMYAPTVRFRTDDGIDRTFQSICYFSSSPYPVGEPIPVRYHPTVARLCGINKLAHRTLGIAMCAILASMFIPLGLLI